jgi:23S rRNA pseudouridine2605 synthase
LFEAAGCRVSRLRRIRFGPVELPRDLAPGRWLELRPAEVRALG